MANLRDILQISKEIDSLEEKTLDALKLKLQENNHTNLTFKEDDDLILIHHNKFGDSELKLTNLENQCRNIIFTKNLEPICYHFNDIIYNPDDISNINFDTAAVQESIEGTTLMCFHHNDKWFTSTRRCIDASSSTWIPHLSYKQLMVDILCSNMEDKSEEKMEEKVNEFFRLLDKKLCYFFVLIHPNNKNIVTYDQNDYNNFSKKKKYLIHFMTRVKGSVNEILVDKSESLYNFEGGIIKKSPEYEKCDVDTINKILSQMNKNNTASKYVLHEGIVIRYYKDNGSCVVIKLQTSKYRRVKEIKPNNNNEQQSYLELFKTNNLSEYLDICTSKTIINKAKIIKRLSEMFVNLSTEVLILYFKTRDKQNPETYNNLTKNYKDILFKLHGIYKKKCKDNTTDEKVKLTRTDVYQLLKENISTKSLCILLAHRKKLIDENVNIFTRDNRSTSLTTSLLHPN